MCVAPWICENLLEDIRQQSEPMPTECFSPARSITAKCVESGQTDARGVLVVLLLNVTIGRLYEDVFIVGSFTEHWVALPSKTGEEKRLARHFICVCFCLGFL